MPIPAIHSSSGSNAQVEESRKRGRYKQLSSNEPPTKRVTLPNAPKISGFESLGGNLLRHIFGFTRENHSLVSWKVKKAQSPQKKLIADEFFIRINQKPIVRPPLGTLHENLKRDGGITDEQFALIKKATQPLSLERLVKLEKQGEQNHRDFALKQIWYQIEPAEGAENVISAEDISNWIKDPEHQEYLEEEIRELNLSKKHLVIIPEEIKYLIGLESIDLSGNNLTSLPKELGQLNTVNTLDLSNNNFTSIPDEIIKLKALTNLDLSGNKLTSIPKSIDQLEGLEILNLSGNKLTSIPIEIGALGFLYSLDLSKNSLKTLPKEIGTLSELYFLNLTNNKLTSIPDEIGKLKALYSLEIVNNDLTSIPKSVGQLKNLETLNLSGNELTSIPTEIGEMNGLHSLNFSNNHLRSLPKEIKLMKNLCWCDLSENRMLRRPEALDAHLNKVGFELSFYPQYVEEEKVDYTEIDSWLV